MKFSICIPNYNYARYLERTVRSVLDQSYGDFEIIFSDNCSTDNSIAVMEAIGDSRIRIFKNNCNVGFARNLDRAAERATGEFIIMLSSDDLMRPHALQCYSNLFDQLGDRAQSAVVSASWDVIDAEDVITGKMGPDYELWNRDQRAGDVEETVGGPVYQAAAIDLLRRSVKTMKNPFNFAATCYPRQLFDRVEGYGGNRLINPDRWFHWKLLTVAENAYFVDRLLFAYRWHANNQTALQAQSGALKYLVDEYLTTFELGPAILKQIGMTQEELVASFVEEDIANHGLATLATVGRKQASRILQFGQAVYPKAVRRNSKAWALRALLTLGPLGEWIAAHAYNRYQTHHSNGNTEEQPVRQPSTSGEGSLLADVR